jgi:deoxyribonuclease-4
MLLGSHLSIAGGMHNALLKSAEYGFAAVGMFVRNQVQWRVPPLSDERVALFRRTRRRLGIRPVVAHGSYLVNLAGRQTTRRRSIDAVAADLHRCSRLGIEYLVLHCGHLDDAAKGIRRICTGLDEAFAATGDCRTRLLLETAAGAGSELGSSFEQLAEMLACVRDARRVGVCLDTCHIFAAGYDIRTPKAYAAAMERFNRVVGLKRLKAIHVNDSKGKLGRGLDRHQHVGRGEIGLAGLANFLNDPRLRRLPFILETPKGIDPDTGRDWDLINAEALRAAYRSQ